MLNWLTLDACARAPYQVAEGQCTLWAPIEGPFYRGSSGSFRLAQPFDIQADPEKYEHFAGWPRATHLYVST